MKTPPNEVHLVVDWDLPGLDVPEGWFIRIFAKRKGGRIYMANAKRREGPWTDERVLDMRTARLIFYGLGHVDDHSDDEPGATLDLTEYRTRRGAY